MSRALSLTIIEGENGGLSLLTVDPEKNPATTLPRIWHFASPQDLGIHVAGMVETMLKVPQ